jgi:glycogen debranching enzyme GlgX
MGRLILSEGRSFPLGSHFEGAGVNFALFSEHASSVSVCLYDAQGREELQRLVMPKCTDGVWHGYLSGTREALAQYSYAYRVDGPPGRANLPGFSGVDRGHRFDSTKLLIDPYARALVGAFTWHASHSQADADNSPYTFKTPLIIDDAFDWGNDRPPLTPMADSVLYEVHVKGFTATHPQVPAELRGRYEGLASDAAVAHLHRLGVTAVSLLPVHQALSEETLVARGKTNYWGYNTIGFFAPDRRFARHDPIREFKTMVKALHAAGIEVILDVVYNHTAEGDHRGATLSFKGIDNDSYYHLRYGQPEFYENYTGCGNALDLSHPRVLQWVMDSLRYWVQDMHVDGFRFDLATTLARSSSGFSARAGFLDAVRQDPVLAHVKWIAEPWDIGFGGYQLGQFPIGWSEWNDRYRDSVRSFWLDHNAPRGELASRLAGSSELFHRHGRAPSASINFVAAHDGFTLQDLVSFNHKHNEANGEENRDGHSDNRSWNCGVEGQTDDAQINDLRGRIKRSILATLLVSQGTPMLLGGDELGRSQRGNNNAYCQDNEINWFDWSRVDSNLMSFTARLIALRKRFAQLRRSDWLKGVVSANGTRDVVWLNRQGEEMSTRQWQESGRYSFGLILSAVEPDASRLMILINGEADDWSLGMPKGHWLAVLDTAIESGQPTVVETIDQLRINAAGGAALAIISKAQVTLKARSLMIFEHI